MKLWQITVSNNLQKIRNVRSIMNLRTNQYWRCTITD